MYRLVLYVHLLHTNCRLHRDPPPLITVLWLWCATNRTKFYLFIFLSTSSSEAMLLGITFFSYFFLSRNFHGLWRSVMSICLPIEVKQQWAMLVLGWVAASVHYCVSDGFAASASGPKSLSAMLFYKLSQRVMFMQEAKYSYSRKFG